MTAKMKPENRVTTGQARKGIRVGHPELSIECPQCHSVVGRRCFMSPGLLGITHAVRQLAYLRQARAAALMGRLTVLPSTLLREP